MEFGPDYYDYLEEGSLVAARGCYISYQLRIEPLLKQIEEKTAEIVRNVHKFAPQELPAYSPSSPSSDSDTETAQKGGDVEYFAIDADQIVTDGSFQTSVRSSSSPNLEFLLQKSPSSSYTGLATSSYDD